MSNAYHEWHPLSEMLALVLVFWLLFSLAWPQLFCLQPHCWTPVRYCPCLEQLWQLQYGWVPTPHLAPVVLALCPLLSSLLQKCTNAL